MTRVHHLGALTIALVLLFMQSGCRCTEAVCHRASDVPTVTVCGSRVPTKVLVIPPEGLRLIDALPESFVEHEQVVTVPAMRPTVNPTAMVAISALSQYQKDPRTSLSSLRLARQERLLGALPDVWISAWIDRVEKYQDGDREWLQWIEQQSPAAMLNSDLKGALQEFKEAKADRDEARMLIALKKAETARPTLEFPGQRTAERWAKDLLVQESPLQRLQAKLEASDGMNAAEKARFRKILDDQGTQLQPAAMREVLQELQRLGITPDDDLDGFIEFLQAPSAENQRIVQSLREQIEKANVQSETDDQRLSLSSRHAGSISPLNMIWLQHGQGRNSVFPLGLVRESPVGGWMLQDNDTLHCVTLEELHMLTETTALGASIAVSGWLVDGPEPAGVESAQIEQLLSAYQSRIDPRADLAVVRCSLDTQAFECYVPLDSNSVSSDRRSEYQRLRRLISVPEGGELNLTNLQLHPEFLTQQIIQKRMLRQAALDTTERRPHAFPLKGSLKECSSMMNRAADFITNLSPF